MKQQQTNKPAITPWYKQFWVWVVIALPLSSIVGGITMIFVAVDGSSDMVVDNYYKKGKAINQVLDQDTRARELALQARFDFDFAGGELLVITSNAGEQQLVLELMHPLEAKRDITLQLTRAAANEYRAPLAGLLHGRYHLSLHPAIPATWRLTGGVDFEKTAQIVLQPQ